MKRSLLIASLLALGLAACGDKPAATQASAPVAAPAADTPVEAAAPATNVAATDAAKPDVAAAPGQAPAAEEKKEENK